MTIKELEAALEATREKISEQLSMVGRSIQSIDPTLYDKERVLEQVIAMWRIEFDAIAMPQTEFKEAIYELAFGDNAINRDFSEEEVIATIKGFAHDSWVAEEFDHGTAMPSVAAAVLKLLTPPHGRFFRNGVEHTLTQEDYNEETCAFVEEQDQPMSSNKWVHNARKQVELPYKPVMELADLIAPHEGDKE